MVKKKKSNKITVAEKRAAFTERNNFLSGRMCSIDMKQFFTHVFSRNGEVCMQHTGEFYDRHYNAIVKVIPKGYKPPKKGEKQDFTKPRPTSFVITAELDCLWKFDNVQFAVTSPITYVGNQRNHFNARYLFGLAVDLDYVPLNKLEWMFKQYDNGNYLKPSIIVSSGGGLHLYYLFKKPIALYENSLIILKRLKYNLIDTCCNEHTSDLMEKGKQQYQGIFQGYRIPGTLTKFGTKVQAYVWDYVPYYDIREINKFATLPKEFRKNEPLTDKELAALEGIQKRTPLQEAKLKWPDWYERCVVEGKKGYWVNKPDLYYWWLNLIKNPKNPKVGHRYFCIMVLAVYAIKCHIPKSVLEKDAYSLVNYLDEMSNDEDNPFTEEDVNDALWIYDQNYSYYPRKTISLLTGIELKENKRNHLKQKVHLAKARMIRDFNQQIEHSEWNARRGRKNGSSKEAALVYKWRKEHPECKNKSLCARELQISRPTVIRWWDVRLSKRLDRYLYLIDKQERDEKLRKDYENEQIFNATEEGILFNEKEEQRRILHQFDRENKRIQKLMEKEYEKEAQKEREMEKSLTSSIFESEDVFGDINMNIDTDTNKE